MGPKSHTQQPGDQTEKFVRLLGTHEQQLSAFVLSLVPNWNDARDITQEVRVRLWQQFEQYDPQKDFSAWARTIAYYEILSYRTRKGRQKEMFSDDVLQAVADEASMQSSNSDARQSALADCLEKLKESQRRILLRCYEEGRTLRQVAREESVSYSSLRKTIYRLRRVLHACIERSLVAEANS